MKTETKITPKAQHTAGEWRINVITDEKNKQVGINEIKVLDTVIATCKISGHVNIVGCEANAKLIAAAPIMLKALVGIKENILGVLNNYANGTELTPAEMRTFIGALAEIAEKEIKLATE